MTNCQQGLPTYHISSKIGRFPVPLKYDHLLCGLNKASASEIYLYHVYGFYKTKFENGNSLANLINRFTSLFKGLTAFSITTLSITIEKHITKYTTLGIMTLDSVFLAICHICIGILSVVTPCVYMLTREY